jgi:hypothetical protein
MLHLIAWSRSCQKRNLGGFDLVCGLPIDNLAGCLVVLYAWRTIWEPSASLRSLCRLQKDDPELHT